MRILVVDDERDIVDLLAGACTQDGHETTACTRSADAIAALERQSFDLLITDLAMPAPDGLELVRLARRRDPQLLALVITGFADRYPMADVLAAGASDLLVKPFRLDEFRARVALAVGRKQQWNLMQARQRGLQEISTEMIRGLQHELETARRLAAHTRDAAAPLAEPAH
ncbi:MAG: response regulator [Acidobacteriota bacterium]